MLEAVLSQGLWSPRQQFGVNVPDEVCRLLASGVAHSGMRIYSETPEKLLKSHSTVRELLVKWLVAARWNGA